MTGGEPRSQRNDRTEWVTVIVFLLLSVPAAMLIEGVMALTTPGWLLARYIVNPEGLRDAGPIILIGTATDSLLFFGMMWGVYILLRGWGQFRKQPENRVEAAGHRSSSAHRRNALQGAILCAAFLCFYAVLGAGSGLHADFFHPALLFVCMLAISFAGCVAAIYGLYALAVKLAFGIVFN